MIDVLNFSKSLAAGIQTATSIPTFTEGSLDTQQGEFSDALILTIGASSEVVSLNSTFRVEYRLGYIYQPETMTESDAEAKRSGILQDVVGYIDSIQRYTELGGAVVLQVDASPWEVSYDAQSITYSIPIVVVAQF